MGALEINHPVSSDLYHHCCFLLSLKKISLEHLFSLDSQHTVRAIFEQRHLFAGYLPDFIENFYSQQERPRRISVRGRFVRQILPRTKALLATLSCYLAVRLTGAHSSMPPFEEEFNETPFLPASTGQNLAVPQPRPIGYVAEDLQQRDWMSDTQHDQDQMGYEFGMPFLGNNYMSSQVQLPPPAFQLRSSPISQALDDPRRLLPGSSRQHESSVLSDTTHHDFMDSRRRRGHTEYSHAGRSSSPQRSIAQQSASTFPYPPGSSRTSQEAFSSSNQNTISASKSRKKLHPCAHCQQVLGTKSALLKHISNSHTRPFDCTFSAYGCTACFGSKNEWKRHIATKHINSGFWRCNLPGCTPVRPDDRFKDFNRKDLFMQHARRCHIPKESSTSSYQSKETISTLLSESATSCYNHVRDPPPTSSCGFCLAAGNNETAVFSGPKSWDARLEHVAQHLERLEDRKGACVEDEYLRDWLLSENILVASATEGQYVLKDLVLSDADEMEE